MDLWAPTTQRLTEMLFLPGCTRPQALRQESLAGLKEAPDDVERLQRELWLVLVLLTPVRREDTPRHNFRRSIRSISRGL
jgi:hypothetical protein